MLQGQGLGGEAAGGGDGAGVYVAQRVETGGGQGLLLAPDALHFADPGVGVQLGQGEEFVAGLLDALFHAQPVEPRALGVLLAAGEFDKALNETGSSRRSALFHM